MSVHSYLTKALGKIARNSSAPRPSRSASREASSSAQEERERREAERKERERQEAERRERERQEAEQRIREQQAAAALVRQRDAHDTAMAAQNAENPEYERMARIASLAKSGATPANEDEIDEVNFIRKKIEGPSYGVGNTFEEAYAAWNAPNALEEFRGSIENPAVRALFHGATSGGDEALRRTIASGMANSMERARAAERQGPNSSMVTAKKASDKMDEISYAAQAGARHLLGVKGEPGDSDLFSRPGATLLDTAVGMIPGMIGQFPRAVETGLGLIEGYSLDDDYRVKTRDTAQAAAEFAEPALDVGSMFGTAGLGPAAVKGAKVVGKSALSALKKWVTTGGKAAVGEGATETLQEVLGGLSEGEAPTGRALANAGLLGGIMGPGFAGTGAAVTKVAQKARERKTHTDTGVDLPSVAKDASLDASGLIDVTGETPSAPKGLEAMYRDSLVSPEESVAPVQEAATAVDPAAQMTPMNAPEAPVAPVTPQVPVDASTTVAPQAEVAARTQVAPEQAEVSPALSPMSEVATEAAPLAETISPETVKAAEATPSPVALAPEVQTKEAAPLKTEESSSRTVEPGQVRGKFGLGEAVQQLKKSPETVSRTDLESVVDPLAEEAVEALHSELPKGIEVDRAIDTVADAWIEALKKDPESFPESPGRIKRKLNQGETSAANILKTETNAEAQTEAEAKTEAEASEKTEPKSKEKAPEKEPKTETKNKEKEKDSEAERKETPAEKEAETESKESESEKAEESKAEKSEDEKSKESKAEKSEPKAEESKSKKSESKEKKTQAEKKKEKKAREDAFKPDYDVKKERDKGRRIRADVEAYVRSQSNEETVAYLRDYAEGKVEMGTGEAREFLYLISDGTIKMDRELAMAIGAKAQAQASFAGSQLAQHKDLEVGKVKSGKASREETVRFFMREHTKKTGRAWTPEGRALIESLSFEYVQTSNILDGAAKQSEAFSRKGNPATKSQLKRAREEFRDAELDLRDVIGKLNATVMNEIAKGENKVEVTRAAYSFERSLVENWGLYFHDYIDSSLLSGPAGRIFDQMNGWSVNVEQASPLTKMLIDPMIKARYGASYGTAGFKTMGHGAKGALLETNVDAKMRQRLVKSKQMGLFATLRNATTTIVEYGDMSIQGLAYGRTVQYYKDSLGLDTAQAELVAQMDKAGRLEEGDGVFSYFADSAYSMQGLGTQNYSASTRLRESVTSSLYKHFPEMNPRLAGNIAKLVDRRTLGFWNVTKRVTAHSMSKGAFGAPQFLKAMVRTEPGSMERATLIRQGFINAKSGAELVALGFLAGSFGLITGPYPDDPNERAYMERNGIHPWSINIGGNYIELPRLMGLFAIPFMMGAALQLSVSKGVPFEDLISLVFSFLKEASGEEGIESAINSLLKLSDADFSALREGESAGIGEQGISFIAGGIKTLRPASSFQSWLFNVDPVKRDTYDPKFFRSLSKKVVGSGMGRFLLPAKTDWTGDEIKNTKPLRRLFGVASIDQGRDSVVDKRLTELHEKDIDITPSNYRNKIKIGGENAKLTAEQQYVLDNAVGAERFHQMELYFEKGVDKGKTDEELKEALTKIMNKQDLEVKKELAEEWGFDTSEMKNSKLISSELSDDEYAALLDYETFPDEDARDKWLDDPENAYHYYMGRYNNLRINDQLTDNDKNLQYGGSGSAVYKAKVAEFNYIDDESKALDSSYRELTGTSISNDYHRISQTEWKELLEEDPERAMLLYEYDTARTNAEISDRNANHSKRKYTLPENKDKGPGGGRGGGGGGSATSLHVPSLSDLKTELYTPKGNKEISSSTTKTKGTVAPVSLKANKTIRSGSGIKTEPKNFQGAKTIKYEKSKTRQPAMGTPYMEYLKGQTTQDTFKAARRYV